MNPEFRQATSQDTKVILELMESFNKTFGYPFDRVKNTNNLSWLLSHPSSGLIWLISCNRDIVGYLALTFGFSFEYGGKDAFIDEFYLLERYRHRGIGKATLDFVENQAKLLGVHAIHLEVEGLNEEGQKLYRSKGFQGNDRKLLTKRTGLERPEIFS